MKAKTVKQIITKKIDAWLASIEDENVRKLAQKNTIVTGGCIASMLLNEEVNDFDLYFRDYVTTVAVAKYYVSRFQPKKRNGIPCAISLVDRSGFPLAENHSPAEQLTDKDGIKIVIKSSGIASEEGTDKPYQYFESMPEGESRGYVSSIMDINDPAEAQDLYEETEKKALEVTTDDRPPYRPVFLSSNAITLSDKVQIVIRFWGDPKNIHDNYDFIHCTNYWSSWDGELVLNQPALEALLARELRYVGSRYPLCSIIRLRKFIQRGWTVNAGQILKMVMQLQAFDLENIDVLSDQLCGVDTAYFTEIISKLKDKDPEKVNVTYLCEIINRMF